MKISHIEHIGIAVPNLEKAIEYYENVLGLKCYKKEVVEDQKVTTAFIMVGDTKIELSKLHPLKALLPNSSRRTADAVVCTISHSLWKTVWLKLSPRLRKRVSSSSTRLPEMVPTV